MINKLSHQGKLLIKHHKDYTDQKKKYINYPKITEYLFNKPTLNRITSNYDNTVQPVYIDPDAKPFLETGLLSILDTLLSYSKDLRTYATMMKEYTQTTGSKPILPKIKYLPMFNRLSEKEKSIIHVLEKIKDKTAIDYVYKWNFMTNDERTSYRHRYPINYSNNFEYDFFGQLVTDRLILFVIEYKESVAEIDIMKQHVLFQMNVHLLRLNKNSDIKMEIRNFIKKISTTKDYVIVNKIEFEIETDELNTFMSDYKSNHVAYLKNPKKENLTREEEEIELDEEPAEASSIVKNDAIKKLINKKIHLTEVKEEDNKIIEKVWQDKIHQRDDDIISMAIELVKK